VIMEREPVGGIFEQFRINHSDGSTPTEQLLSALGERSFLRIWSHANPRLTSEQELCDLLVVCGDYVIIFSDKSVNFQFQNDINVAWRRWYRAAVSDSVRQLNGAHRSLFTLLTPVYKDRHCQVPLGISIPSIERARVYRVAVVSQSGEVRIGTPPPAPFLNFSGAVTGDQHFSNSATSFSIGDVSPDTDFVHIIDLAGLSAVLGELDTVTDFARYLEARSAFIRGQGGNSAENELSLLSRYLLSFTENGDQLPLDSDMPGRTHLSLAEWLSKDAKAALRARKQANRESYLWDSIVNRQAQRLERQSFDFSTFNSVEDAERVLRNLALETRLDRRVLVRMWKEACLINEPDQAANIRTVPHHNANGVTYIFFTLGQPEEVSDEDYRAKRRSLLQQMMLASLIDFPDSKVVIGIASELGQEPSSYDLAHLDILEDTNSQTLNDDARAAWEFKKKAFGSPKQSSFDERDIPAM
jgi:hypothetical protein